MGACIRLLAARRRLMIRIQTDAFDVNAEIERLRAANPRVGAIACFIGVVRDLNEGASVASMTLEHYPGMTEKALEGIVEQARARWDLYDVLVIHRVGELRPTDPIVLVIVTSAHRGEAFAACEFVMDYLKTEAPFWKKEATPEGGRWVDARESDDAARERWKAGGQR
jgi:molybdopterin synthase catalytic subunit